MVNSVVFIACVIYIHKDPASCGNLLAYLKAKTTSKCVITRRISLALKIHMHTHCVQGLPAKD